MLESLATPWTVGAADCLGAMAAPLVRSILHFEPDSLWAAAGVTPVDDVAYPEALDRLCTSLEEDANLSLSGRLAVRAHLIRSLATTARLAQIRHDGAPAVTLRPPLIVVGLPRSGTTWLHRLLALAPDARAVPFWELRDPLARPGPDTRRAEATTTLGAMKRLAPELDAKHFFSADEPEECTLLFDCSLWSGTFYRMAPVYGYLDWYHEQDPQIGYQVYRELLEALQAKTPDKRLVLKAPDHVGYLAALLAAIPEAKLVQTHRDPAPSLVSYCSLMRTVHGLVSRSVDVPRASQAGVDLWARLSDRNLLERPSIPAKSLVDLDYELLRTEPVSAVQQVCDGLGLDFDPVWRERVASKAAEQPQHKHGRHNYEAADFGLDPEAIRARFSDYWQPRS